MKRLAAMRTNTTFYKRLLLLTILFLAPILFQCLKLFI